MGYDLTKGLSLGWDDKLFEFFKHGLWPLLSVEEKFYLFGCQLFPDSNWQSFKGHGSFLVWCMVFFCHGFVSLLVLGFNGGIEMPIKQDDVKVRQENITPDSTPKKKAKLDYYLFSSP